jgi:hypothetical protein
MMHRDRMSWCSAEPVALLALFHSLVVLFLRDKTREHPKSGDTTGQCRILLLPCVGILPSLGGRSVYTYFISRPGRLVSQLRACYFSNLAHFSADELRTQLGDLEAILAEIAGL